MKKIFICCLLALGMLACGDPDNGGDDTQKPNVEDPSTKPEEKPEPKPEPEPAPAPDITKDVPACSIAEFTNWQTNFASGDIIGDFSGLCFNKDKSGLVGVSNYNGRLYNINFDGTREEKEFVRTGKDMEGVTLDPETGIYYLSEEGGNFIWTVTEEVTEEGSKWNYKRFVHIDTTGTESNGGLEGITYHDGYLYVANQSPAELIIYSLEHQGVALSYMADFITECFSDLWFDTTNNTLWAVDAWSSNKEIVNFTIWGELIARFKSPVPWIEGICIDFENNKAWFACDSTGQLYSADIVRNN